MSDGNRVTMAGVPMDFMSFSGSRLQIVLVPSRWNCHLIAKRVKWRNGMVAKVDVVAKAGVVGVSLSLVYPILSPLRKLAAILGAF